MKRKAMTSLIMSSVLLASIFSGCAKSDAKVSDPTKAPAATEGAVATDGATASAEGGSTLEPYTFEHYFYYNWWTIHPWGEDEASKFLKDKFNVQVNFSKPDADDDAKFNLMVSSGDLPDAIMMERGSNNIKLAQLGLIVPLDTFQANNKDYDDNILKSTQELLKIDGKLYNIPNWARKSSSGGNDGWMYDKRLYEAAGSPDLSTFEGLYAYAKKIKDSVPTTEEGLPTIPLTTDFSNVAPGHPILRAFYRSMGGYQVLNDSWFGKVGEDYKLVLRDDLFKKATMEANKWYREGLIADTQFTDTREQIVEKLVAGRTALVYYDQSKDDENHFRTILRESFPGDSYEMVVVDDKYLFPPANGLSPDKIYADIQGTVGWNVTCITTKATNPQRIFDLYSYFLTKEGSINMMYGPKGDLWDELDSTGNPILKTAEGDLSSTERDRLGLWFWNMPGHSDNVDLTKFAVNEAQPADKRSWVISNQANLFTPLMKISDEYTGIADIIDNQSDTGIKRKLCEDYIHANMPKVIMASSEADASKLYDDLIAFCDKNGMAEIETLYTEKYKANCELQGGSVFK